MTDHNARSGSQPPISREVDAPATARATRFLRRNHPPNANSLIRISSAAARAAPRREPSSPEARVAALRDAAVDIATTAARTRTRHNAASAMRAPDLRHAGMTPRRFRISFTANERLIEKLVLVTALLGEEHDEPAIDEVLEFAVDALICACRGG